MSVKPWVEIKMVSQSDIMSTGYQARSPVSYLSKPIDVEMKDSVDNKSVKSEPCHMERKSEGG